MSAEEEGPRVDGESNKMIKDEVHLDVHCCLCFCKNLPFFVLFFSFFDILEIGI